MGLSSRIYFSQSESTLIRSGLECLCNRLAGARAESFPYRNQWDRIDLQASDIYRSRNFSEPHAQMILSLRDRLQEFTGAAKIRLGVFELAAVSLAARISRTESGHNEESKSNEGLRVKIEKHRRRAKRTVIGRLGQASYEERSAGWQQFVRWMRYHLLSRYTRRPSSGALRKLWNEQYEVFSRMAETAIAERQYAAKSTEALSRIVRLALSELRRRRHPLTIRGLCANEDEGKEFLFEFALAREAIRRSPGGEALCLHQSEVGSKIRTTLRNPPGSRIMAASTNGVNVSKLKSVSDQQSTLTCPKDIAMPIVVTKEASPEKKARPSVISSGACAFDNEQIANAVAQWFQTHIDPGLWAAVQTEAQFQITQFPMRHIEPTSFRTLGGLIAKTRVPVNPIDVIEMVNNSVDWLLGWLIQLRRDQGCVQSIVGVGYARANKSHGLFQAEYS